MLQIVKLPCELNIVALLEGFVHNFACNLACKTPEKPRAHRSSTCSNVSAGGESANAVQSSSLTHSMTLCKQIVDGIRVSFDFHLPLTLLYNEERPQYEKMNQAELIQPAAAAADDSASKNGASSSHIAVVDKYIKSIYCVFIK